MRRIDGRQRFRYGSGMNEETEHDDDDGPTLAIPPLYVLRTAVRCPDCGKALYVYTLGCDAFHDAEDSRPTEVFHFLRLIESLPDHVLALLKTKCPDYYADTDGMHAHPYLMNHCPCGAKLDDDFVTGDVGAAFFPDTPDGYLTIKIFCLPIDEPIPIQCSYSIGGDEYLDFATAEPW
jgi:hypothetical protein